MKLMLAIILSLATQSVFSVPIETIESKQTSPLAPRGGVLMVQLITESNGKQWPFEIDVVFEGGFGGDLFHAI